jgi:hypothetical protein
MYPYYRRGASLSANDIGAARALYGAPAGASSITTPSATVPAPAPASTTTQQFRMTADPSAASVSSALTSMTGTVSGGTGPFTVQWQTDHGYSGAGAFTSATGWNTGGIALVTGTNNVSITAFDSSHHSATQTVQVIYTPAPVSSSGAATSPICVSVSTPSSTMVLVNGSTISVAGAAGGGAGIAKVTWQTSTGASGVAAGTTHWLASSIPLMTGTNTVVIRAFDASGASAWVAVVAVRN